MKSSGYLKSVLVGSVALIIALLPSQNFLQDCPDCKTAVQVNLALAVCAGLATDWLIPKSKELFIKAHLFGRDMHRKGRPEVPEAMGVVVGACYGIALSCFLPFVFVSRSLVMSSDLKLSMFMASLLSINAMCFLGFADNVLNLKWRVKIIIPFAATLPLL